MADRCRGKRLGKGKGAGGIFDDGSSHAGFPSIAVNRWNDIMIGYARLGTNIYPSAAYRVKEWYRPEFASEQIFAAGQDVYTIIHELYHECDDAVSGEGDDQSGAFGAEVACGLGTGCNKKQPWHMLQRT